MNPVLVGRNRLRTSSRRPESGVITLAVMALTISLVGAGVAQSRAPENRPLPTPSLRAVAGSATLGRTLVAAPPTSFGFAPPAVKGGSYVLRLPKGGSEMTIARSQELFAFYLDTMPRGGWTLQAKGDPSPAGDWTLRWQHAATAVLISYYTSPHVKLQVDVCPPNPYC